MPSGDIAAGSRAASGRNILENQLSYDLGEIFVSIFLVGKNLDGKDHLASTEEGQEVSVVREVAITLPPTFGFCQQKTSPWQFETGQYPVGIVMIVPFYTDL